MRRLPAIWRNTRDMPLLLRVMCRGGMIVAPVLLVLLIVPAMNWTVDGRLVSHAQLWRSGAGPALALLMLLVALGCWGLAARRPPSRWLLVAAPVVPYVARALFPDAASALEPWLLVEAVAASLILYVGLFHTGAVRTYLADRGATSPSSS